MFKRSLIAILILTSIITGISLKRHVFALTSSDDFTLTWQANSYAPPEYVGKKMATQNTEITVVATPASDAINWRSLNYVWTIENTIQEPAKGKNYHTFTPTSSFPKKVFVRVTISDETQNKLFEKVAYIKLSSPEILFYPLDERGVKSLFALKNYSSVNLKPGDKKYFVAEPYFFPSLNINQFDYRWTIDNEKVENTSGIPNHFKLEVENRVLTGTLIRNFQLIIETMESNLKLYISP